MKVMSETHTWFGPVTLTPPFRRFGATGKLCFEFVVALNFRFVLDTIRFSRMIRATRL